MCRLIILDDNIPFKGIFSAICKALNINYDVLTVRNHKGLLVEKFHHFINKAITIAVEDRGTNDAFIAARVATGYIYNSFSIDGTNILRSSPAVGRELYFPFDIDLSALPTIVSNNAESVASYLRLTDFNHYLLLLY